MKWLVAGVVVVTVSTAHADKNPWPALFDKGHTWKLEATQFDGYGKHTKGSLACEVVQVVTVGATQLSRIHCHEKIGDTDDDWGGLPTGIYTLSKAGLGVVRNMPEEDVADRMKDGGPGMPLAAAKPVAFKRVSHSPVGNQQTTDVVTLRAFGNGWCYTEAGDFDSNEYTVCFDKTGLVGARFQKVGADGHWDFGKVPAQYRVR